MFFKRDRHGTSNDDDAQISTVAERPNSLSASDVRRVVDPALLGFETTDDVEPASGLIGQDRALKAIQFGADIKAHDFNMFVLGPPASGKTTAVKAYLKSKTGNGKARADWVYVNNFEDDNQPLALKLPAGRGRALAKAMLGLVDELRAALPAAFEADDFQIRARAINDEFEAQQDDAFEALNKTAEAQNIAILKTPTGFTMAPMSDGAVVKPEIFNGLPEAMRKEVEAKIEALQGELVIILERMPRLDKKRRARLAQLHEETAQIAVSEALADLRESFGDLPDVVRYVNAVEEDLVSNAALFALKEEEGEGEGEEGHAVLSEPAATARDPRFRRYLINVMVGRTLEPGQHPPHQAGQQAGVQADDGPVPIIEEPNPTYASLIGRIEHIAQMGALMTDFLLIKPGALHRANGGFLLLDARKLLLSPFTWEALKRTIKARAIRIEQPTETQGFASTQSIEPQPIALDVKVILFGDHQLYYTLSENDPEFSQLFKVQADFDNAIARSAKNDRAYAQLIRAIIDEHDLKRVDADGVARLIDEGARLADDREKLSIEIGRVADILREADYWAGHSSRDTITRADIARAIREHTNRSDRLRDHARETIDRGVVLVDTSGDAVGQINGLSVSQLGDFSFGRPARITARVRMGTGRVTDIEREAHLGGSLHSKGVMILWGFLAGRYALDVPLALAASLVFEQSYGGVDGDSASSTELYALLSALSDVPIKQSLAVTGAINQRGDVQAIGGVNEKIEGFFDVCLANGLTGEQGVMIPKSNVQHLMLREDVVEAIDEGRFGVYPITHIDEGIEILTGVKAGARGANGRFQAGTINRLVEDRLRGYACRLRNFRRGGGDDVGGSAADDSAAGLS